MLTIADLPKLHASIDAALRVTRGSLRRLRPAALDAFTAEQYKTLVDESPALRLLVRNPAEHDRVVGDIRNPEEKRRRHAAAVALHHARAIPQQIQEARETIAARRRDVAASFPNVLDHLSADGMATATVAALHIEDRLARASAAELVRIYPEGLRQQDLRGYLECTAIERMVDTTPYAATTPEELQLTKQLRSMIDAAQEMRLPKVGELPDFDRLEAEHSQLNARATVLRVGPLDPARDPAAASSYTEQVDELTIAGEASDEADLVSRRDAERHTLEQQTLAERRAASAGVA